MAIRMMSGLPARISECLQDFLPTELNLIDAEEADGLTTPPIPADAYYEWDQRMVPQCPACCIRTVSSSPVEVRPDTFGARVWARHRLDLLFHATLEEAGGDALGLQRILHRYVLGAVRVLCVMKEALQTTADPTRFVEIGEWSGEATYGPEIDQEDGAIVRTAILPIEVTRRESR